MNIQYTVLIFKYVSQIFLNHGRLIGQGLDILPLLEKENEIEELNSNESSESSESSVSNTQDEMVLDEDEDEIKTFVEPDPVALAK